MDGHMGIMDGHDPMAGRPGPNMGFCRTQRQLGRTTSLPLSPRLAKNSKRLAKLAIFKYPLHYYFSPLCPLHYVPISY